MFPEVKEECLPQEAAGDAAFFLYKTCLFVYNKNGSGRLPVWYMAYYSRILQDFNWRAQQS